MTTPKTKKKPKQSKSPISKNKKNYYRTPEQRLQEAEFSESLMPSDYDLEDPEFKILLHELDKIKLYLYDITRRLTSLEERIPHMTAFNLPPPIVANPFDRNAMYKGPNAGKGQDFVRKNVAMILKNMLPPATLALMPDEVRKAYHNILSVMGAPNDPVWEKEIPKDPREPVPTDTFKNVSDLWNNVANNLKKLDGINLSDEIAKAAADAFGVDGINEEEKLKKQSEYIEPHDGVFRAGPYKVKEEPSSDQSSQKDQDDSTTSRSKESDK